MDIENKEWPICKGNGTPEINAKIDRKMELGKKFQEEINNQIKSFEKENGVIVSLELEDKRELLIKVVAINHALL